MSESNPLKKPNQESTSFENRNINRLNKDDSIYQNPDSCKPNPASRPSASSKSISLNAKPETMKAEISRPLSSDITKPFVKEKTLEAKSSKDLGPSSTLWQSRQNLNLSDVPTSPSLTPPAPKASLTRHLDEMKIQLVERDFAIFEFILDMKFASRDEIFEKFFSTTKSMHPAKSNLWALERLAQLEKAGFLKGIKSSTEQTRYFLPTKFAYDALHLKVQFEKIPSKRLANHTLTAERAAI